MIGRPTDPLKLSVPSISYGTPILAGVIADVAPSAATAMSQLMTTSAGATPDAAFDHGDDRCRRFLDGAHHAPRWVVVGQRITAIGRQLSHIVPGGPDLRTLRSPEHDHARPEVFRSDRAASRSWISDALSAFCFAGCYSVIVPTFPSTDFRTSAIV